MTQEEIIRMAREAGLVDMRNWLNVYADSYHLERFAALVAEPWIETNKALAKEIIELQKQAEQEHSADTGNMVYSNPSVFDGVCCGCSKKAADGWALYCVECWEKSNGDPFANGGKMIAEQAEQEPVAIVEDWPTDSTPKGIVALGDIKEFPAGTLLYASPAISTEVFTREKVDSLLIAAYTKGRNDLLEKQAEQEPVAKQDSDDMRLLREIFILCEATEELEPTNDFMRGRIFEAKGIRRGIGTWYQDTFCGRSYMGEPVLNAAPVRTKDPCNPLQDLTDDEIDAFIDRAWDKQMSMPEIIRAVIAADREKNK